MASNDPIARFRALYEKAAATGMEHPDAMVVASVGSDGRPSVRVVLLKGIDERGVVFYTNMQSRKGREISANPHVAIDVYWRELGTQIVLEGTAARVPDDEADAYFASRPRRSQLGARASRQSEPMASRLALLRAFVSESREHAGRPVPRPAFWSGFRVEPTRIEFWRTGRWRLHEREEYVRAGDGWQRRLLYP